MRKLNLTPRVMVHLLNEAYDQYVVDKEPIDQAGRWKRPTAKFVKNKANVLDLGPTATGGYRLVLFAYKGYVWVTAGCRAFTFDEAVVHWYARQTVQVDHTANTYTDRLNKEVGERARHITGELHTTKVERWIKRKKLKTGILNDPRKAKA